jgi:hypothetical protein
MVYAARITNNDAVGCMDEPMEPIEAVRPLSPPIFYQNELGVVTNRRQFEEFFRIVGRPVGPYVFVRR